MGGFYHLLPAADNLDQACDPAAERRKLLAHGASRGKSAIAWHPAAEQRKQEVMHSRPIVIAPPGLSALFFTSRSHG